jgi:hypothetical protein
MTKDDIIRMAAGYTREKLQQLVGAYAEQHSDLMVEYLKLHEQNKRLREKLAALAQPERPTCFADWQEGGSIERVK